MGRDFHVSPDAWLDLVHRVDRLSGGRHGLEFVQVWDALKSHRDRLTELERKVETNTDKVRACQHPDDQLERFESGLDQKSVRCSCGAWWFE